MAVRTLRYALSVCFVFAVVCPAAAQPLAYVSATVDDTFCQSPFQTSGCTRGLISVVNTATNQVQASIDVWRGADARLSFGTLLVNPAGDRLYAVLTTAGSSHPPLPSFTSVRVFDTLTLSQIAEFTLNGVTRSCTWSSDGARLFCARNVLASDVAVIDTATHSQVATIAASFPTSVVMSPDGRRLYIAHNDNRVTVHDGETYALLTTVPLPAAALALEVTLDGEHLYAALNDQSVADIDTTTDTVAGVIPGVATGSNLPLDIAFASGNAYVPTGGGTGFLESVTVIDVASRTIETTIPVINPLEVAVSFDERRVFVSREFALSAIDTSTNQVVASTSLPDGPGRLALSPPAPFAAIVIDAPSQGAALGQPFVFGGWAVDVFGYGGGPGIDAVHVWAFPASGASPVFVGAAEYGRPRSDIATLFGPSFLNSGYQMTVRGLTPGAYTLTAFGHSTRTGTFSVARQVSVTVASGLRMAVDAPVQGATALPSFVVAGWALDGSAITGSGIDAVHVWAYPSSGAAPSFAGAATLGHSRPDVAAAFGSQFGTAGYALAVENLAPGSYTLIVYARQASTGTFAVERAVGVTVTAPQPFIFIDVPAPVYEPFFPPLLGTDVRVAGWAIELGAATGTGVDTVHVWAYPTSGAAPLFVGAAYGTARPDVGAIFGGRYTESGFDLTGSLPPGAYDIVAFAHSTTTNSFNGVQLIHVIVVQP